MNLIPWLRNLGTTNSSSFRVFADDIEAEASYYYLLLFSGLLDVDSLVQILVRFKKSIVFRDQIIFCCMMAKLFREFTLFPMYQDRELRIAAMLVGSIIKRKLVIYQPLWFALHCVLYALNQPVDSKLFMFGSLALEQCFHILIDWPQYCNHILRISHLRTTHPNAIAFIEQALAKISSGHAQATSVNVKRRKDVRFTLQRPDTEENDNQTDLMLIAATLLVIVFVVAAAFFGLNAIHELIFGEKFLKNEYFFGIVGATIAGFIFLLAFVWYNVKMEFQK